MAKAQGCRACRSNGNVNERELIEWLAFECWPFWSELLAKRKFDEPIGRIPEDVADWPRKPPQGREAWRVTEWEFQWLRLVAGDQVARRVRKSAENALRREARRLPAEILALILDGLDIDPELYQPPALHLTIPRWRLDGDPLEIVGACRREFWEWTQDAVDMFTTPPDPIPEPLAGLIVRNTRAAGRAYPPRICSNVPAGWREAWEPPASDARSLLDFLPK